MKRHHTAVAVMATAAVLTAVGCGGSGGDVSGATPASDWADGFCLSLTTWTRSISSLTDTLESSNLSADTLGSATDDVKSATRKLTDDLRALGKPDTESGEEAKDSLDRLATGLTTDTSELEQTVGDVVGVTGVIQALPVIGRTLSTMGERVQTALQELEQLDTKGEIEDALTQATACDFLTK